MNDFKLSLLAQHIELALYRQYGQVLAHTLPQLPLSSIKVLFGRIHAD